jgi:hypothetical protein
VQNCPATIAVHSQPLTLITHFDQDPLNHADPLVSARTGHARYGFISLLRDHHELSSHLQRPSSRVGPVLLLRHDRRLNGISLTRSLQLLPCDSAPCGIGLVRYQFRDGYCRQEGYQRFHFYHPSASRLRHRSRLESH